MPIIWDKIIPRWSGDVIEPPEAKKDVGYIAGDKPPAKWENWLRKGTYEALDETRDVIENIDSQLAQMGKYAEFRKTSNQSIENINFTQLTFQTKTSFNSEDFCEIDGVTGRIKILENGIYEVAGFAFFAVNSVGIRALTIEDIQDSRMALASFNHPVSNCAFFQKNAGGLVSLGINQSSGGSLDVLSGQTVFRIRQVAKL